MKRLKKYLFKTISDTFFPLFFTLYSITSVILLVKIASYTSVITISFLELIYLYMLSVPQILLYTLPITFFISMILNLSKLSAEYELIVITSFGLSPLKLLKIFLPISFLFSFTLFIISFILIPQANYLEDKFMSQKSQDAQFNIKPSEYGQRFGPWYIYVEKKTKKLYKDIILFKPQEDSDRFILAKQAFIQNQDSSLSLNLFDGSVNTITKDINQIDFEKMIMNNHIKQSKNISSLDDIINYWKDNTPKSTKRRMILQNTFIALLPLISILFYVAFGYFNPRYQKNRNTIYAISLVIFYMVITQNIATHREYYLLVLVPIVWIIISILFYIKKTKPYY